MSFVFFDTETTGLKLGFDQIVRFAAIRTDTDLNEIERFEARARLLPHVLPHPSALLTNGLFIQDLTDPSLPSHLEMVDRIQRTLVTWSPAVFIGFNSIRFDEEMLRHALFQNLYPPYLTSYQGNCRADALNLFMAADALSPAQLIVPYGPEGRRTFRLQALSSANGIDHQAHDALSDVLATLALCRLVLQRSPDLWQRFVRFSNKAAVADFVDAGEPFVLTEFLGTEAYHSTVVCIGRDPAQPNGRICLNLGADIGTLTRMTDDEMQAHLRLKPCPIRRLRVNAAPTLTAIYEAAEHMLGSLSAEEAASRADQMANNVDLRSRLIAAYVASRQAYQTSASIEANLYSGFAQPSDEARLRAFHRVPWESRLAIVETIEDERLRWFGRRLVYLEARASIPKPLLTDIEHHFLARLFDKEVGSMTFDQALDETSSLMLSNPVLQPLLATYQSYLQERRTRATAYRERLAA